MSAEIFFIKAFKYRQNSYEKFIGRGNVENVHIGHSLTVDAAAAAAADNSIIHRLAFIFFCCHFSLQTSSADNDALMTSLVRRH